MKNRKLHILTKLILSIFLASLASCKETHTVNLVVTEEDGSPIENAKVSIGFIASLPSKTKELIGNTNAKGAYSATEYAQLSTLVRIEKEGYYQSEIRGLNRKKDHDLKFVLYKKIKPIALYAKRLKAFPTIKEKDIGYDLEIGDWVGPNGRGVHKDVIFNLRYKKKDYWTFDFHLVVKFPNPEDGIAQFENNLYSKLKGPHKAPQSGYKPEWIQTAFRKNKDSPTIKNTDVNRGHWMRVRSKVDENGNLVSANYVKIYGDFPDVQYYFNPTPNDRNLEFDPKKNLFKNLEASDLPREP